MRALKKGRITNSRSREGKGIYKVKNILDRCDLPGVEISELPQPGKTGKVNHTTTGEINHTTTEPALPGPGSGSSGVVNTNSVIPYPYPFLYPVPVGHETADHLCTSNRRCRHCCNPHCRCYNHQHCLDDKGLG